MARDIYEDADAVDAEPKKEGLANALVIVTTIVLLIAFFAMEQANKKHFDAGMFGSGKATPTGG